MSKLKIENLSTNKERRKFLNFKMIGGGSFTAGRSRKLSSIHNNKTQPNLSIYRAFLLDMDGVLHNHGVPINGAKEFLKMLDEMNHPYMLLTNEGRFTNKELSKKLKNIIQTTIDPQHIYSTANSTRDFFKRLLRHGYDELTYVIGEKGLIENIKEAYKIHDKNGDQYVVTGSNNDELLITEKVGYVVIGSVFKENTRDKEMAARLIRKGARLVHTCPDYYELYSDEHFAYGMPMPTVKLLEKTCDVKSYNLGKPNPHMIRMAQHSLLKNFKISWKDVLFIGDSLNTDIRTAIENGIDSALMMSGCTNEEDLEKSPLRPNYVFEDIKEFYEKYSN